jgi:hypothetical protein
MSGHLGAVADNEILPKWDPNLANLALDIGKIISSDHDLLKLIETDIDQFHQPNRRRCRSGDGSGIKIRFRPRSPLGYRPLSAARR